MTLEPPTTEESTGVVPTPDEIAALLQVEHLLDQRWPETKIEPSLTRIAALMDLLGSPQRGYPSIHIAGTNGKTSVARMVDALLTALQRRTGRTTSPHLQSAVERIAIDGKPISPATYVATYRRDSSRSCRWSTSSRKAGGGPAMSKFEVLTAMAFAAFADAPIEVAVIEVGLGGRWDATNVVNAPVAVITPISVDHVEYLGDDIAGIAGEKAGIIQKADEGAPDTVAVIGRQVPEAMEVLLAQTVRADAAVAREDSEFAVLGRQVAIGGQVLQLQGLGGVYSDVYLPLHGEHQAHNAAVALAAVEAFFGAGAQRQLDVDAVRAGFAAADQPRPAGADAQRPNGVHRRRAQPGGRGGAGADAGRGVRFPVPGRGGQRDGRQGRRRHPRRAGAGVRPDRGHPQRITARSGRRVAGAGRAAVVRTRPGDHRREPARRHRYRDRAGRRRRAPTRTRSPGPAL